MNVRQHATSSRDGITAPLLMAHSCDADTLAILLRFGWVTETVWRDKAGDRTIELTRLKITEAGRRRSEGFWERMLDERRRALPEHHGR